MEDEDCMQEGVSHDSANRPTVILSNRDVCGEQGLPCAGDSLLSTIDARIAMYSAAQTKAKSTGESSKVRRYSRALATLTDLRRKVKDGKAINEEDIPPVIASGASTPASSSAVPTPSPSVEQKVILPSSATVLPPAVPPRATQSEILPDKSVVKPTAPAVPAPVYSPQIDSPPPIAGTLEQEKQIKLMSDLKSRRETYKSFALKSKAEGNKENAVWGVKAVKLCDMLVEKVQKGDSSTVDVSVLPPLPGTERDKNQASPSVPPVSPPKLQRTFSRDDPIQHLPDNPDDLPAPDPSTFGAPPPATTIEEALKQRLAKYQQDQTKAKEEGNVSRARETSSIILYIYTVL